MIRADLKVYLVDITIHPSNIVARSILWWVGGLASGWVGGWEGGCKGGWVGGWMGEREE